MKKVLITGSNGLLGQKLIYQLVAYDNFELVATARGINRTILKEGYTFHTLDITNESQINNIFDIEKPDVVINAGAMTNVDECESKREECWKANVDSVKYLGAACEKHNAHLIHVSTDFIFDGEEGPYDETGKPNPLSYYGDSKLAAEKIVENLTCKWSIARTVLVFGVIDNMSRSNIVLWAKNSLEAGKKLTVVDDQWRTPTLAEDLANGCIKIALKEAEGIFNISGGDNMCVIDLVKRVARYFKLDESLISPISSSTLNQAAVRPPKTGFIIEKAINELGYLPMEFEEALGIVELQIAAQEK